MAVEREVSSFAFQVSRSWVLGLAILSGVGCVSARSGSLDAALDAKMAEFEKRCACRMGVAARHLESGKSYFFRADDTFESASVIKIAILTEAMAGVKEGRVDLSERWTLPQEKKADGSGVLLLLDAGLNPTWNDLIILMIGPSDNTATNAWMERLGIENINGRMASLGFKKIHLLAPIPAYSRHAEKPSPWTGFRLGEIAPREVAEWMARVARGELLDPESSARIFEYLDKDPTRLRIARRFDSADLFAGKSGSMSGVRNDSGILRTKKGRFVLAILTDRSKAVAASTADHPSVLAIADAAKAIVDGWSRELPELAEKPK
jgi:beta-lactamase class A